MNKSQRIKTEVGSNASKNIKVKLEQNVDQYEILSLKINQKDVYQFFNCDYGVLVGRVIANGGVGIPNAKVSIFIPLSEEDELRSEIRTLYPYKSPRDKNTDGKRYNLLPRVAREDPETGRISPNQPFGSFPTKEEIVTNETMLEVYDTYYKYSTITNDAGDYMLFGVPIGVQTVHMSVDITDIGRFSMTPQTLVINLGFSPNLFTDNGTRIKPSTDLDDLPNIETQEISVDVIPFCGDEENFEVGITRQDFRIRAQLVNSFIVFGTNFTMPENNWWNDLGNDSEFGDLSLLRNRNRNILGFAGFPVPQDLPNEEAAAFTDAFPYSNSPISYRIGPVTETIFYIPNNISDEDAANYNFNPQRDLIQLTESEYTRYVEDGQFVYILPCNRKKVITSETGEDVEVPPDNPDGVFTEFYGIFLMEMDEDTTPIDEFSKEGLTNERTYRAKFRIPQAFHTNRYAPFPDGTIPNEYLGKFKIFKANRFYSVSQFIHSEYAGGSSTFMNVKNGSYTLDRYTNSIYQPQRGGLPKNGSITFAGFEYDIFAGEWLNMSLFFTQYATLKDENAGPGTVDTNEGIPWSFFVDTGVGADGGPDYLRQIRPETNTQPIGAGLTNTAQYFRADRHFTDFIEIPLTDLLVMKDIQDKGFFYSDVGLTGDKRNTNIRIAGSGNFDVDNPTANLSQIGFDFDRTDYPSQDDDPIFYKGLDKANIFEFLDRLNII